ncbi:MAG: glycosyltransferase family 39 protein [Candidatus Levyibacteriota bacterium]
MFEIAFLIGIYGYIILALGFAGLLYKSVLLIITLLYIIFTLIFYRNVLSKIKLLKIFNLIKAIPKKKFNFLLILLLAIQGLINLTGVFSPEFAFDALWYHLTLPKLYLINSSIYHIPGGLLYYSSMPKFTELLYIPALAFSSEIFAKLIHFSFGVLTCIVIYKLSRKFLPVTFSIIAVIIFYSNIVVSWQSTTAYIDLARAFFEILALWGFIEWVKSRDKKWLIESGVLIGLAVSVKILSLMSLLIFFILILMQKENMRQKIKNTLLISFPVLVIISPWLILSFINTGNPVYPFLSGLVKINNFNLGFMNPLNFISEILNIFIKAADPISPIYLIFIPLILIKYKSFAKSLKLITIYVFLALLGWYFFEFNGKSIPEIKGGARYLLPYLPAFSILISYLIYQFKRYSLLRIFSVMLVIFLCLTTIGYRSIASIKYIPYLTGKETKDEFLTSHLNFSFGDFYDTDGYFKNNIKDSDKVLLYGFHNLYYIKFPFIDSSWVKKGDSFNFIAVQNAKLPERFKTWDLIYLNPKTNVKLYSEGGIKWQF